MPVTDFIKDHITLCFSYIAVIFFTNNAGNQILLTGSVVLMLGRSNCDTGTSIQCSTYFMDGEINPIYADYMTYHHGSIKMILCRPQRGEEEWGIVPLMEQLYNSSNRFSLCTWCPDIKVVG